MKQGTRSAPGADLFLPAVEGRRSGGLVRASCLGERGSEHQSTPAPGERGWARDAEAAELSRCIRTARSRLCLSPHSPWPVEAAGATPVCRAGPGPFTVQAGFLGGPGTPRKRGRRRCGAAHQRAIRSLPDARPRGVRVSVRDPSPLEGPRAPGCCCRSHPSTAAFPSCGRRQRRQEPGPRVGSRGARSVRGQGVERSTERARVRVRSQRPPQLPVCRGSLGFQA